MQLEPHGYSACVGDGETGTVRNGFGCEWRVRQLGRQWRYSLVSADQAAACSRSRFNREPPRKECHVGYRGVGQPVLTG